MKFSSWYFCAIFTAAFFVLDANYEYSDLGRDLEVLEYWQNHFHIRFPATYNFFSQGGYFMMPSARMGEAGELAIGFSTVPPYYNYSVRCQLFSQLELSGSYRVFRGVEDSLLSPFGFGDFADKGINAKFALFRPEDSNYKIPGLAIGWDDFLGTKEFEAQYIVATQVIIPWNLELSLGWGRDRIHGFFGGALYMPFWGACNPYIEGLALSLEYDAIDYKNDPHPKCRSVKWPLNYGLKYRFFDYLDLFIAQVRGEKIAMGANLWYNFGSLKGFLPKIDDKLPYTAPVNYEPLGSWRPLEFFIDELKSVLCAQGLILLDVRLYFDSCGDKTLRILFYNDKYRLDCEIRNRLSEALGSLLPQDVDQVIAVQYAQGFSIQEYCFWGNYLRQHQMDEMGEYELAIVSPLREVTAIDSAMAKPLYKDHLEYFEIFLLPRTHFYFGSSRGKFKYAVGATLEMDGFVTSWDIFWRVRLGMLLFSDLEDVSDVDMLNPSQLINVHTDVVNYEKQNGFRIDECYLQKNMAFGYGWYGKLALGYFDPMYGGACSEILWYPICSSFAVGLEGAFLLRRDLKGLGFTDKIRKLNGYQPTMVHFLGSQFFLNLYYDLKSYNVTLEASLGKFLANDWGGRAELARYFESGLRIYFWYTFTNGNDQINGHTYFDKGVGFSMPLDIFFTCSSTSRFGYSMNAWLRDVGYQAPSGRSLYDMIYYERQ